MDPASTAFSWATESSPPRSARWAGPTIVTRTMSGSIIAASAPISPGALIPASTTAKRCRAGSSRQSVSATPIWLFRLPSVASTPAPSPPRRSARSSLVEVLPALPVIPTTVPRKFLRCSRAIACSAARGSATTSCGRATLGLARATTAAAAPALRAEPRKSWPSRRSVLRATKACPGDRPRESTEKPTTADGGAPDHRPPVQAERESGSKAALMFAAP